MPSNPLKDAAFHALGQAYSLGYLICGVAALVAAVLAAATLHGLAHRPLVTEESLAECAGRPLGVPVAGLAGGPVAGGTGAGTAGPLRTLCCM